MQPAKGRYRARACSATRGAFWGRARSDWTEMDFGDVSGLYDELAKRLPEALQGWADDWFGYTLPGGERRSDVRPRQTPSTGCSHAQGTGVAVVTHLGCIRFALGRLLSGGPGGSGISPSETAATRTSGQRGRKRNSCGWWRRYSIGRRPSALPRLTGVCSGEPQGFPFEKWYNQWRHRTVIRFLWTRVREKQGS